MFQIKKSIKKKIIKQNKKKLKNGFCIQSRKRYET